MVLESKGKINISVLETKKVSDVVVVVSVPCNADLALYKLACSMNPVSVESNQQFSHTASTILAWSVAQCCAGALHGSPLAVMKTRVSQVSSNVNDGFLNVCFNTQSSLTYVKKALSFVMKCFSTNVFSIFDKNVKALHLKVSRDEFEKASSDFLKAVASKVQIAVVGKINMNRKVDGKAIPASTTLKEIRDKLESLLPSASGTVGKTSTTFKSDSCSVVKTNECFVLAAYVKALGGIPVEIVNGTLHITNANWDTIKSKLASKDKIETFLERKYGHKSLEEHLNALLAYQIATAEDVKSAASKKISMANLEKSLLSSLK
jgi:hypothetical protein